MSTHASASGRGATPATPETPARTASPARILRPRLRKLLGLLPKVMTTDDPEAVHDLRVASRRLQQGLETAFPKPQPRRVRVVRKTVRGIRRALGGWRDCDVVLELIRRRTRRIRSPSKLAAWTRVEEHVHDRRARGTVKGRRRLARRDVVGLPAAVDRILARRRPADSVATTPDTVAPAIAAAISEWHMALERARRSREVADLHALRVATKRLRYRIELATALPDRPFTDLLPWLKKLQQSLGDWHDRQSLYRMTVEAIADPDFLLRESQTAGVLLAELVRERRRDTRAVDHILRLSDDEAANRRLEERVSP